ncbi:MAG: cysteine--tRNA ligase [Smithellaceae bacterium]|nr:cysteine--tRNA ligase [Syntrophaceae bacterium]MDD4239916.1 cysteine--tRNA ligase [Smithellaceae bacterium]NLX51579.1 cysteine--tRNA ligase [Deltaproteobacteria bacterium]
MPQKIFNTKTRQKEVFQPIEEGAVGMYVCGITAYDVCHVGHARAAVVFDVIFRHFKARGYRVTYVKNFTDIDDKIIDRANREGVTITDITDRYIRLHDEDMAALNVLAPTITPKATEHMQDMIALIRTLEEKGIAYAADGDVFFAVGNFRAYGGLSGRNLDEMLAGARVDVNDKKRNPLDFVLWKKSKEGEPSWESPWGPGRPGWHIECSAMSRRYLGDTFDIHGGGEDLVFPHHENEIAQSQAATGKAPVNYWVHNGFVKINAEKMSKSLGNIFPIREIIRQCHPEVLRLFMIQSHYRSPVDYSDTALRETRTALIRCYTALKQMKDLRVLNGGGAGDASAAAARDYARRLHELSGKVDAALDDDFNTAQALGFVFDAARLINAVVTAGKNMPVSAKLAVCHAAAGVFAHFGDVLGIFQSDPDDFFRADRDLEVAKRGLDVSKIEALIREREQARAEKDWSRADDIRRELAAMGVALKDAAGQTSWLIE